MGKGDQLIRWAGGDSVFRQQPKKLVILRVSVSDRCCNEYRCDDGGKPNERIDDHGLRVTPMSAERDPNQRYAAAAPMKTTAARSTTGHSSCRRAFAGHTVPP
jgi:hypothetical protein